MGVLTIRWWGNAWKFFTLTVTSQYINLKLISMICWSFLCANINLVLEKSVESPLDCKDIQPVHPKGDQSCVFTGRTMSKLKLPILWPPDGKSWLIWKDPDAGKDWRREEKGTRGWDGWMAALTQWTLVWVNSGSSWWTGSLACCSPWGRRVGHDWATETNWTELTWAN